MTESSIKSVILVHGLRVLMTLLSDLTAKLAIYIEVFFNHVASRGMTTNCSGNDGEVNG